MHSHGVLMGNKALDRFIFRRYNGRRGLDAALLRTVIMGRAMRPVSGSPLSMTIMFLTESGKTKSLERLPLRTWSK